ncbi:phage baseplate assembly protein V [Butyrivibrio sp. AE3004]|uniref:phage baseplate assembly protein V n=1 Tax=Butyrivibrio sp. AE3004 TaxID=1506994 RepID=UPI000493FAEF|nr:phage baseplate assembly protein V [Butyrivibrio sp. AE3004]
MPFFDIVDDVARHQMEKTDMWDNRINGVMVCTVVKNYDKEKQGFVQVNITTRDYSENRLVWARMALQYGGDKWGSYFIPEVGDQVIVAFEQGCIERAFIIGAVPKNNSAFMKGAFDENNKVKRIKSKNGNTIDIIDNKEGEGDNDKITLTTAKGLHKVELDNEKKKILVSDKDGENKIEIKTENGQMEIVAKQKLTIKVGDNIKVIMNGSNGTVSVESTKLKIDASDTVEIKSNNRVNVEGGNVAVSGNSMLKLKSSGPVSVEGTPIKLG